MIRAVDPAQCKVCGDLSCEITIWAEPPAWSAVKVDGEVWVNIPVPWLNWNWTEYETQEPGSYCWEDLCHQSYPHQPEPFDLPVDQVWRCNSDECDYIYVGFPHNIEPETFTPGCPSSIPPCPLCGDPASHPIPLTRSPS